MTHKKAQGLSLNTIIIAVIVLIVLVVLIVIFSGKMGDFGDRVSNPCSGTCKSLSESCTETERSTLMDCNKDSAGIEKCCIPNTA